MWSLIEGILAFIGGAVIVAGLVIGGLAYRWGRDWYVKSDHLDE